MAEPKACRYNLDEAEIVGSGIFVGNLSGGDRGLHRQAVPGRAQVDLGRETILRTAEILALSSPCAGGAVTVLSIICTMSGMAQISFSTSRIVSQSSASFQSPELPVDQAPLAELLGQVAPRRAGAGDPERPVQNKPMIRRASPPRTATMKGTKNAYSASDIKFCANRASVAKTILNQRHPPVNTVRQHRLASRVAARGGAGNRSSTHEHRGKISR